MRVLSLRPRRLARLATAAAAAVAVSTLSACNPPTPDQDAFYTPPTPLPSVAPGDVLRSRPSVFTLDPAARTPVPGITATQVLYRSTDANGAANAVSGTVLVPDAPWLGLGSRPLVAWAVGTRGVGDACAPSYTLSTGTDYEGLFIQAALNRGWAVAVSDYEGLGTPGLHTYVVGQSEGRALLDMARAATRLPGSGLSSSTPVGLMGYSQGGGAAGWAAELAGSYAPELKVKGTAAGGIPGDLTAVADFVEGGPAVALALLASLGLDAAYPELDLENYLNSTGAQLQGRGRRHVHDQHRRHQHPVLHRLLQPQRLHHHRPPGLTGLAGPSGPEQAGVHQAQRPRLPVPRGGRHPGPLRPGLHPATDLVQQGRHRHLGSTTRRAPHRNGRGNRPRHGLVERPLHRPARCG